jgi:hypothetical protein
MGSVRERAVLRLVDNCLVLAIERMSTRRGRAPRSEKRREKCQCGQFLESEIKEMATLAVDEPFARHRIKFLRGELARRFQHDDTLREAITGTLDRILGEWDVREPLHGDSHDTLTSAIKPILDKLLTVPVSDAKSLADRLVRKWDDVRCKLNWG